MNVALILSGGAGERLGAEIPKQYIEIGDRAIISYCLEQLSTSERIDAIQIVAAPEWQDEIRKWIVCYDVQEKFKGFSEPGENRQLSVLHGLEDIRKYAENTDQVLIHDAARPLLSHEQINACLDAMSGYDGVIPVLPMKDTVYYSMNGKQVSSLLNRNEIYAGQAPEVFVLGKYLDANRRLSADQIMKINGSTEPAIMAGMNVAMIPGDERNFKITTRADLDHFRKILENK